MRRNILHLSCDFQTSPARRRHRNIALISVTLLLMLGLAAYYVHLLQTAVQLERENQGWRAELASQTVPRVQKVMLDASSLQLLQQFNTPWESLLDGLEAAATESVALLSMQPNARQGDVILTGEAARYSDILAYIERLKMQPAFSQAYLTSHAVAEDTPGEPVHFTILLKWRAAE